MWGGEGVVLGAWGRGRVRVGVCGGGVGGEAGVLAAGVGWRVFSWVREAAGDEVLGEGR